MPFTYDKFQILFSSPGLSLELHPVNPTACLSSSILLFNKYLLSAYCVKRSIPGTVMQTGQVPALMELPVLDISPWMSSRHLIGYMMKTDDICI